MQELWNDEAGLIRLVRAELYTAVVGDVMDKMGLTRQFLPPHVRPLREDMVVFGRAMTVLEADYMEGEGEPRHPALRQPFGLMLEALDDLKPNEVYLCSGGSPAYALWGELMSTRAMVCGAAGAVVNGHHRDTKGILSLGFPTFSYGPYAQDQALRGKVIDYRCSLDIAGTKVKSGDMVIGDIDGVLIVPRHAEQEVFTRALEKARGEKVVQIAIQSGMPAVDAFEKYGIM